MSYYGVIQEIWELDYHIFPMTVFKCDWVENNNGVKIDKNGMTLVDLSRKGYKSDSFIFGFPSKALGKPEHSGPVQGVGKGPTLKTYFKNKSRGKTLREQEAELLKEQRAMLQLQHTTNEENGNEPTRTSQGNCSSSS